MIDAIARNLEQARRHIAECERKYAREPGSVQLIAVSKTRGAAEIAGAVHAGQRDFGENYLQEALGKQDALAGEAIRWHFIGPIQSNKTRALAERFDWIHSVDRLKVARRLDAQRPPERGPLNILLQVNVSGEASKSGLDPLELEAVAGEVARLPRLRLRGLMAIPAASADLSTQRASFRRLAECLGRLREIGVPMGEELSMGMSGDYEAAIAEGATMVRLGTSIFGARG